MDFDLLVFDLDNTLLKTDSLGRFRGAENTGPRDAAYIAALRAEAAASAAPIYPLGFFVALRTAHPQLSMAVFSRSPRCYVETLLAQFYPGFAWNQVVAFEDVAQTKPDPEGILRIAQATGHSNAARIAVIGDDKSDIQAAYHAGVWAVSEETAWPARLTSPQYRTIERMPDARVKGPEALLAFLSSSLDHLPLMEVWAYKKSGPQVPHPARIERVNHFDKTPDGRDHVPINILGRRFRNDEADRVRREWHPLTTDIEGLKDAAQFPDYWIGAIRQAITALSRWCTGPVATITVIPAKPGRTPRLENLLGQLEASHAARPIASLKQLRFDSAALAYTDGVRSNHGEFLNGPDRFTNLRDHLTVPDAQRVTGQSFIVLDDVVTTGATLFYAHHYLRDNGALSVQSISFAKAVSTQ